DSAGCEAERLLARSLFLGFGDGAGFDHSAEHHIAACDGALALMAVRVQRAGLLNHAREQRAFRQIELADILAEVSLGGLAEPVDAEGPLLAERDLVGVHLEELLLGIA